MNYNTGPRQVPPNGYASQNMTPGLKIDAENMLAEKTAAALVGVPKPSVRDYMDMGDYMEAKGGPDKDKDKDKAKDDKDKEENW
ncbi:hypothetical protein CspeluHIS016_0504200 [Cutaneotrichosporon spelunceum]|uniref:Uncharacterized protein n=1 Tax=Cutaneotrichosporon spelunceum TaxID=1672016 RepID=A0AAD3YDS0_9TREE|nr:hypothetical protein CspeluHIS016_0504200 [Cutaneotrichosporon spelunceum]